MIPRGSPQFNAKGLSRFLDRLVRHGLEYFGLYYGVYRGFVVDNTDPENSGEPDPMGRLKVRVPAIGDGPRVGRLAYPIVPFAGDGFGLKAIPPVGAVVYVQFENGKIDTPFWCGSWWGDGHMPGDLASLSTFGLVTPGGSKIVFDDTDGAETILLESSVGSSVRLDSEGNISITNRSGRKVNVGDSASTANEPAVLGTQLKNLLSQLIDAITVLTVPTGVGPSGTPVNAAQFAALKVRLEQVLSRTVNVK